MTSRISATIVAYKNYKDVARAVNTLEKYTSENVDKRIYIVDNTERPSKDYQEKFRNFLGKYRDVEYIKAAKNLGFGKGHNLVLGELDSKYHAIVNPDIVVKEDVLGKIIEYMDANPDVGMCVPKLMSPDGRALLAYRKELTVFDMFIRMFAKSLFKERVKDHTLQHMNYDKEFNVPFAQGSFLVIRTDMFKKLGGFDEGFFMYLEDADLCKRVNQISRLMYFPGATVYHKWEQGSHKSLKLFKIHVASMIHYFNKWGWKMY